MRTTINLPDDLYGRAKRRAARSGTTVTALSEAALRELLARRASLRAAEPLPVYGSGGLRPRVDLDDTDRLLDTLDAGDDRS